MNILEHMKELGFDIAKAINYKDLIAGKEEVRHRHYDLSADFSYRQLCY